MSWRKIGSSPCAAIIPPVAPTFTADASVGGYAVTATVKGSSVRTAFSLLNLPRG